MKARQLLAHVSTDVRPVFHRDELVNTIRDGIFVFLNLATLLFFIIIFYEKLQSPSLVQAHVPFSMDKFDALAAQHDDLICLCNISANPSARAYIPQQIWDNLGLFLDEQSAMCVDGKGNSSLDVITMDLCVSARYAVESFAWNFYLAGNALLTKEMTMLQGQRLKDAFVSDFATKYLNSLGTLLRLGPVLYSTSDVDPYAGAGSYVNLRTYLLDYTNLLSQNYSDFMNTSIVIGWSYYAKLCNPQECTYVKPESALQIFLATIAMTSAIHGILLLSGRAVYTLCENKKWHRDIGLRIREEIEREKSRANVELLQTPSSTSAFIDQK